MEAILAGLLVFFMRLADMSLDTLRMLFMMRGRKVLAALIGAIQAAIFILAVSQVLRGPLNFWTVLGYALGFGAGVFVGMVAEEKLALGYSMFQIFSAAQGAELTKALREAGHAVTVLTGQGKDSTISVLTCAVSRKDGPSVRALIVKVDPAAFVTVEEVKPLHRGYFRE
jgi:uncharacterized protein YebE (UPF0316 family)